MLFEPHLECAGVLVRAHRDVVEKTIASVQGFPREESARVADDALVLEREFLPHKCMLRIELRFVSAEGGYINVELKPYRVLTQGRRRVMATISLRGKPIPEGRMLWVPFVDRHGSLSPQVQQLARRFWSIDRMKMLDENEVAIERLHLLFHFALRGPKSLV